MSATTISELDEILTLLERILPNPRGYGERLLQQAVLQWANSGERRDVNVAKDSDAAGLMALLRGVRDHEEVTGVVLEEDLDPAATNALLSAALGACECWGLRDQCPACRGNGCSGWVEPDVPLFHEFVSPAVAKLSATLDPEPANSDGSSGPLPDAPHRQSSSSREGVDT